MEDLSLLVPKEDIHHALRTQGKVLNYNVTRTASDFQGFSSLMLKVQAEIETSNNKHQVHLIAKVLPPTDIESGKQRDTIERFQREELFFSVADPLLRGKCQRLPVVQCLAVRPGLLILEDLCQQGYRILPDSMKQVGTILLKQTHVSILMQRLADFHAASLDTEWTEKIILLQQDNFFRIDSSQNSFYTLSKEAFNAAGHILSQFYPGVSDASVKWLTNSQSFNALIEFSKKSTDSINVLAHGDFWINNMMFKEDKETRDPIDVCFIDFQLCRYVHPTRDILHVMYTCLDRKFRQQYEAEMLKIYVERFNECAGSERLKYEQFLQEYEKWRLIGTLLAIVFRSLNLMSDIYPDEAETLTTQQFEEILCGHQFESMPGRFRNSPQFREAIQEILEEFLSVFQVSNII